MSKHPHPVDLVQPGGDDPTAVVALRLRLHSPVGAGHRAALERLLGRPVCFPARSLIAQAGEAADLVTVIQEGVACRMTVLPDARRQIHSLLLPGETADAEAPLLRRRVDNVEALTTCSAWLAPKTRFEELLRTHPDLAQAFAREAAIASQVAREWVVNLGRRDGVERVAHLLCELYARMHAIGRAEDNSFPLPLTQNDIADAQGMSAVHVNRVLQELRVRGLIRTEKRRVVLLQWQRLQELALFDPLYLHLPKLAA